jgi:ATP-dependent Clp protease ATP-binding subunit ClpA
MPKINIYLPDDLAEAVREANVPVSAVCQRALEQAVRRVTAIREATLSDLEHADLSARFPHVTKRALTTIKLGIEQARWAHAPGVGSAHLLVGILAEGAGLALHILRAMEIDPDRVTRELATQTETERGEGGAQRFSAPAAAALELAAGEATALGHNYVGTEHLLLGLIAEPDGVAGQVLRSLGAELRLTRRAVTAALAGYVHLQSQTGAAPAAGGGEALAGLLEKALEPLVKRIERLEERVGAPAQ